MSVIEELIRLEDDGTLSFGNHLMETKKKVLDFEVENDLYKVKTFNEITRLEKNGRLVFESVPGVTVHKFSAVNSEEVMFTVEGSEDAQITLELAPNSIFRIIVNGVNIGNIESTIAGKVNFSVELKDSSSDVIVKKIG